jgi:hypothetical protein
MSDMLSREKMRDEFLDRIDRLYEQVRKWILNFDSKAEITEESLKLVEEPVGSYLAHALIIKRSDRKTVSLIPRGRWIIGAEGRVDIKSDLGTETLVYVLDGGPAITINMLTENGKVLATKQRSIAKNLVEGWVFVQNRQIGLLPSLDENLFCQLLEVLGQ